MKVMAIHRSIRARIRVLSLAALTALLALVALTPIGALAVNNPVFDYSLDLPIGWVQADNTDPAHIGFFSPNADAMIQVIAIETEGRRSGVAIAESMLHTMDAEGEPVAFSFQGYPAALSDIRFVTSGMPARGYLVTISIDGTEFVLLAFAIDDSAAPRGSARTAPGAASASAYDAAHDHLLSAIDSFAIGGAGRLAPGPISQFFHPFPAPADAARAAQLGFFDVPIPFAVDPNELDATAVLVEREARLLAPYGALDSQTAYQAWRRYFRMIYRDNFLRLEGVAAGIDAVLASRGTPRVDYPREILRWLQSFDYSRAGGVSDFLPPLLCLVGREGDCDSLAMTYVIILHHLGFDSILMVSDRYAHAVAAVDVHGPGARFEFEGRRWLIAELTAQVEIGQIAASMADPAGWIGVRLRLVPIEAPAEQPRG
ncbi:MAG: hypothetical protein EA382_04595 [Spirochaetaceae bacterium]|nr:MAG: hypothetical protein EA382_04595 [Spirochaetaceae bacterium]